MEKHGSITFFRLLEVQTKYGWALKGIFLIFCIGFLIIFSVNPSFGQSERILKQEKISAEASGVYKVQMLTKLAEMLLREGYYKKAIKPAKEAKSLALDLGQKEMAAVAMNREGKATYSSKNIRAKRKGEKLLTESLEILPQNANKQLRVENLELLVKYARLRGDVSDEYQYKRSLAKLKGLPPPKPPEKSTNGGIFKNKNNKREMIEKISEEKAELTDSLQDISANAERLKLETDIMNRALNYQNERISNLSKAQMKQELHISQQNRIVDSLNYARFLDSFKLQQNSYKLQEQKVILKEKNLQIREKEIELDLKNSQRNFWIILASLGLLLGIGLWWRYNSVKSHNDQLEEKNKIIEQERERSDELLLNILPTTIAEELKSNGVARPRKYDNVSVLFTDFVGFSKLAKQTAPETLIFELDFYFKKFDEIIIKYGLEKIKTIGDSYMCAGGLPNPDNNHPIRMVKAAIEIHDFMEKWQKHKAEKGELFFEVRIGIHTGPVVAGVVGKKKYAYDIWGDTVNIASRMEANCEPGQINISKTTYELVKQHFQATSRGKIQAKNIGEVEMFYINL